MRMLTQAVLCATVAALAFGQGVPVKSYKDIKYPPLRTLKVPEPLRYEMPNGMVVYLLEDHELPKISVSAMIRTGSRLDPKGKEGLAQITGRVMRTGGTATRNGDELDKQLDRLGAVVETGISRGSGNASVSVLKEDIDQALTVLADVLQHPAFPQDKIDLMKTQLKDAISRRNDDSHGIVAREFPAMIYGKDSPYASRPEYDSVNAITRDDLVAFHKTYFQPENVILGVYGDFATADMRAKVDKAFGAWAKGGQPKPPVPEVDASAKMRRGVYVINKDDVNQSEVMVGELGGKRNDPDYYANAVASTILGGGFDSRLMNRVRSDEGLAYATYAAWQADWDHPGTLVASAGTKSGTTIKALTLLKQEMKKMGETEVSDAEFQKAKDAILKGAAFDYDSTGKIIGRLITYEYFGYPKDTLQREQEGIRKVTKADVLRVAKQYWNPDNMAVLILGKTSDFDQPVAALGDVKMVDITIPKPKEAQVSAATGETLQKGKALLLDARKAMGGDKIASVKAYTAKGNLSVKTPQGDMTLKTEMTRSLDGRSVQKMVTPMGEMTQGFDGKTMWAKTPAGVQEAPPAQTKAAKEEGFRETLALLSSADKYSAQSIGSAEIGGKKLEGVLVKDPATNQEVKVYIDPSSKMIGALRFTAGAGETEELYTDYKDVDGIKLPSKVIVSQNGQKRAEVTIDEITLNPAIADNLFAKP